jgi:hypothetical protein
VEFSISIAGNISRCLYTTPSRNVVYWIQPAILRRLKGVLWMVELMTLWALRSRHFVSLKPLVAYVNRLMSLEIISGAHYQQPCKQKLSATVGACWWKPCSLIEVWRETIRRRYICGCNVAIVQRVTLSPGTSWQRTSTH